MGLIFIDSLQLIMSSSLKRLDANLPEESFKYTREEFKDYKYKLMTLKGVYPYDYMDT